MASGKRKELSCEVSEMRQAQDKDVEDGARGIHLDGDEGEVLYGLWVGEGRGA